MRRFTCAGLPRLEDPPARTVACLTDRHVRPYALALPGKVTALTGRAPWPTEVGAYSPDAPLWIGHAGPTCILSRVSPPRMGKCTRLGHNVSVEISHLGRRYLEIRRARLGRSSIAPMRRLLEGAGPITASQCFRRRDE